MDQSDMDEYGDEHGDETSPPMEPVRYPCRYLGGFKGMRPSDDAVLEITGERFSVTRPKPRALWARTYRVWAKWIAVTELTVTDEEEPVWTEDGTDDASTGAEDVSAGSVARVEITTRLRGTGEVVVSSVSADELWEAVHAVPGLAQRFPRPTEDAYEDADEDVVAVDDEEGEGEDGEADTAQG